MGDNNGVRDGVQEKLGRDFGRLSAKDSQRGTRRHSGLACNVGLSSAYVRSQG